MSRVWLLLVGAVAIMTFALMVLVVIPQAMLERVEPGAGLEPYRLQELRGREVYIQEGCVYCHTQQVRDPLFTTDQARGWGGRPTVPADYVFDDPHLLGTMRTGPDLVNVATRLPDPEWHYVHFYQPRAVVPWSIMPSFPYFFVLKDEPEYGDVVVDVPEPWAPEGKVIVAKQAVQDLVAYLLSLDRSYPVEVEPRPEEPEAEPEGAGNGGTAP